MGWSGVSRKREVRHSHGATREILIIARRELRWMTTMQLDKSRFREEKLVLMFTKVITKTVVSILTEISYA